PKRSKPSPICKPPMRRPVIMGFTSAAAIIIAASQLKYLFGMEIPRFEQTYETIHYAFTHLTEIHWLSFAICTGGIVLMLALKRWAPVIPAALAVSVLSIALTALFRLDELGLAIVGTVPEGLPSLVMPEMSLTSINAVLPTVLTVTIIGIVESLGIAKALELKNKDTKVLPNQELLALGFAKVVGSFFQAIPSSASFTRSAINNEAGAKTGIASIVAAVATGLTLIFFTPLFYYLPEASLAAIVLMAVRSLFEIKGTLKLWRLHRLDFSMLLITFVMTLVLGIEEGVLTGVVLSCLAIILRASRPHAVILGELPESGAFRDIERFPSAIQYPGVLIVRFDAPLFFLNATYFKEVITQAILTQEDTLELLILDASSILDIDSGGLDALEEINELLKRQQIKMYLTGVLGPVRDRIHLLGLEMITGEKNHFLTIKDALRYYHDETDELTNWSADALQYFEKRNKRKK
ncbi:MAG: SulP family inorganic anion transporter, partial [Bacteroidota bacterium]